MTVEETKAALGVRAAAAAAKVLFGKDGAGGAGALPGVRARVPVEEKKRKKGDSASNGAEKERKRKGKRTKRGAWGTAR